MAEWQRICMPVQEMHEMLVQPLGWEDPLEKEMASHPSILAWDIPWTEEPGELQSMGVAKSWTQPGTEHRHTAE